jgi:apolipoprotein N-acyltransferase
MTTRSPPLGSFLSEGTGTVLLALASGLLIGISMPPGPYGPVAGIAWVPLLLVWSRADPRQMAVAAFGCWLTAALTGFAWVLHHVLPTTALASAGGVLTWAFVFALPWPLSAAVRKRGGRWLGLASLLAFHLTVEGLLSRGLLAFPWGLFGHALAETPALRHLAALGGVGAASAWLIGINALVFTIASDRSFRPALLTLLALLVGGALTYGGLRSGNLSPASAAADSGRATVLLVQPGTPPTAWADVRDVGRLRSLQRQTREALDTASVRPDLVVWPETALPVVRDRPRRRALYRSLHAWVDSLGVPVLTGGVGIVEDPGPASPPAYTNRVWFFAPTNRTDAGASGDAPQRSAPRTYDKVHLVPFAEHVPLADRLPALDAFRVPAGGVPGYVRGEGPALWSTPLGRTTPLVCFESVALPYMQTASRRGAQAFVTVAQTGWWNGATGPRQHRAFTQMAAVAVGRPVVLASVRGPSTVIGPYGRTTTASTYGSRTAVLTTVPRAADATPFVRRGDLPFVLGATGSVLALLVLTGRILREYLAPDRTI